MEIARVEPLTRARALRGPFDYLIPPAMSGIDVGTLLVVPFGRRRVLGVVVGLAESSQLAPERLAEPIEALEAGVPPELVRLGLWLAGEYCSTPSRGLSLVLPPGTGPGGAGRGPRRELRVSATAAGRAAIDGPDRLGTRQRAVLEVLREGERSAAELASDCRADRSTLRRLEARGMVQLAKVEARRTAPALERFGPAAKRRRLTPDQQRAVAELLRALDAGASGSAREFLLHGVTGSGKTEVYLAAAEAALERGRGAIVLVPEIALTPQTASRFRERFGDTVALLHSRLPEARRRDEWRRLRDGEARLCVGPRSAVFAPVRNLGLVVVDEEHDPSYKHDHDPRYDARSVARHRAAEAGALLVVGSATPRPESWHELPRIALPHRVDGRALPEVEILDMTEAGPRAGPLHERTRSALDDLTRSGGKAIILINRRGFAPYLSCRSCGHHWGCPACDVSLVTHRSSGSLRCHHCGHTEPAPESCPECGSVTLARQGAGTERIEEVLAGSLESMNVFRLDSDTAASAGGHEEILRAFEGASSGVLLGTQMVAKGHDFPDVSLAVVLDADATLRFPDFRAEERTFALLTQLAGRSGRGDAGGRVLVQTLTPEASSIRLASKHDAEGFLAAELERRAALRYPPFSTLIGLRVASHDPGVAVRAMDAVAARLEAALPPSTDVLGPAPLFRLAGRHRRQLLLKARGRREALNAVRSAVEEAARERSLRGANLSVDVDPQ